MRLLFERWISRRDVVVDDDDDDDVYDVRISVHFFPKHHHGTMILKPYSRLLPGRGNMKKIICMTFHNDL